MRLTNYSRCLIVFQLLLFCLTQTLGLKSNHKMQYCDMSPSRCMDMNNSICLGVKLPYSSTSSDLVLDADTPEEARVC